MMTSLISWSGGKDSCLALWRSQQKGLSVSHSLTVLDETGLRTRSHGVSRDLISTQIKSLGLAPLFIETTWQTYEAEMVNALQKAYQMGISQAIFGDIDLAAHKTWEESVCQQAGLSAFLPLWNEPRTQLVHEFLQLGFKARVVCVNGHFLTKEYVGCEFNLDFIRSLPPTVDPCGECGEFHTFVYDGPNFKNPIQWISQGIKTYTTAPNSKGETTNYYFDWLDIA